MGGNSQSRCISKSPGLSFLGETIEANGGFVSCRSELFSPTLDLSSYKGIQLNIEGRGKKLKFAISCKDTLFGVKWVGTFSTDISKLTIVKIPFNMLEPNIRAKKIFYPFDFNPKAINRFQLLYSKFGESGLRNETFVEGKFQIFLHSINAYE